MLNLDNPIINKISHRIVFTGGPLGGKSTVMNHLQKVYSHKARFMTEVASMLLASGYPQPGRDIEFSDEWLDYINHVILPTQLNMENGHIHAADLAGMHAVFFDRGLRDPAAYLPGGTETLRSRYHLDTDIINDRYTLVIHLRSVACHSHDLYNKLCGSNPSRYDTAEQAEARDNAILEAWKDHPNRVVIESFTTEEALIDEVLSVISPLLDVEMECKYVLPRSIAWSDFLTLFKSEHLEQYYIYSRDGVEVRARKSGDRGHFFTVKGGTGYRRSEWEVKMPGDVFNLLSDKALPNISKTRYYIPHGKYTLELDVYDKPSGLVTMECEFKSDKERDSFTLPDWAEGAVDVTEHKDFKNINIAKSI